MIKEKSCLDCLHKCHAECCKYLSFVFPTKLVPHQMVEYYKMHKDTSVIIKNSYLGEITIILVYAPCKFLDKNDKCIIHNEKMNICKEGYKDQKHGVIFHANCCFEPGKGSVVLKEGDICDNRHRQNGIRTDEKVF